MCFIFVPQPKRDCATQSERATLADPLPTPFVASRASTVVALCTVFLTSRRRKCSYPRRMSTPTDSTVTVLIVRCVFVLHREGDAES